MTVASRRAGNNTDTSAATSATAPSRNQSRGKIIMGSFQPKASTLTIASSTQASESPTGIAATKVAIQSTSVRATSRSAR